MDASNLYIRFAIELSTILFFGAVWLSTVTFLRFRKKKSFVYLTFFTVFYVYLFKVLDYTLLQFQSLLLLRYFIPGLMLRAEAVGNSINLIPLVTLTLHDLKTSLLNVLLLVPFGFGLPFITSWRMIRCVVIGAFFSIIIELLQLVTGFLSGITFRIVDINDVIFNTTGAAIGYLLFTWFVRMYRRISPNWKISSNPILLHIADRPQIDR